MKRVVVIGTTGSGKTRFAGALAQLLGVPHIELDRLNWNPNWQEAPREVFIEKVRAATEAPAWVVDGNYRAKVAGIVWQRADTIIWLDYPFRVVISRLLFRTLRRTVLREECCNGNRESLSKVFSNDSIILWAFKSHWRRQREYPESLNDPANEHLLKVQLRSPAEADAWLKQIEHKLAT